MSDAAESLSDLERTVLAHVTEDGPLRPSILIDEGAGSRFEVMDALWRLNSLGLVRVTPDSRWERVR